MAQNTQTAKALAALIALSLFATACTKQRDATLSEDAQETIFAISEIDSEQTQYQVNTDSELSPLSLGESSKATAEKGMVSITEAQVPDRLKFMFRGLEITGQASHSYKVMLSVDKQFVTAYKVVNDLNELSLLEKQLVVGKEEISLQKQLQKAKNNAQAKALVGSLKKARDNKQALLTAQSATLLVPMFKFPVKGFGTLNRIKNELREETSNLRLKATDWSEATHIQISNVASDRVLVGLDPASRGDLDRTFVMDKINNKLMTAGTLNEQYQIPVNLEKDTRILTLLDVDALHIFEIGQVGKTVLTDSQLLQLRSSSAKSNVKTCTEDILKSLPAEAQKDCVMILRYDVPVSYVRAELPVVDYDGNQSAKIDFKPVRASQATGLVQIAQNVEARKVEANTEFDPRTTVKIKDILNKEFFFKRTLEQAAFSITSPGVAAGMAGALTIVKFDLDEKRLVVRKADQVVSYQSGSNEMDYEELMSIPVTYKRLESKDSNGAAYSVPRLVPTSRKDAEYVELDWTHNSLPQDKSPYSSIYQGCLTGIADTNIVDVDMRLEEGILNFSQQYSAGLSWECIGDFSSANGYNGTAGYQASARFKERISFKLNDGSTDKSFVTSVPFSAQNAMGYGVWTIGKIAPNKYGRTGREGMETALPMVHDFRNGKKLVYTVVGLPTDNKELRDIYVETTQELINSWNLAYKQAFKGSALERSGNYLEFQIAGENGVEAHLGDLDKNIIYFENKISDHGILGVSQVGFNPRSAIVVADSLIMYAGNIAKMVDGNRNSMKIKADWDKMKENFREQARKQLAEQEAKDAKSAAEIQKAPAKGAKISPEAREFAARKLVAQIKEMSAGKKADPNVLKSIRNLGLAARDLKAATAVEKTVGKGAFKYASPQNDYGWMDKVFRAMAEKPGMTPSQIEGLMAKEMLASKGAKLSSFDRAQLTGLVKRSEMREKLISSLDYAPGCMKTSADVANGNFLSMPLREAIKLEILNTMVHEMGHSQGLTHNFIGSFDKKNFANEDGTASKRNYSSVMDYLTPGRFNWDGLGSYDIRALRASHLGLIEVNADVQKKLAGNKELVSGKYVHVNFLKKNVAGNAWTNLSKQSVANVIKEYKYCTDIDVGYEPTCQRHDFGSSAEEIVSSIISDWESMYVNAFHSWDRINFGLRESIGASSWSSYYLNSMRVFMDELFYNLVTGNRDQATIQDLAAASVKSYLFYNQLINTPDAQSTFKSAERFQAVVYEKQELNAQGQPTGKVSKDVEIVEKRAIQDLAISEHRVDTVGLEYEKIAALSLLTMKGFPSYKYAYQGIQFSFLDFEKYILGMDSPETSIVMNTIGSIMLDKLSARFSNDDVKFQAVPGAKATVTNAMRFYAGIFGVLNLESSTLRDKDNFATLLKVGSTVGAKPSDRVSLSALGTSETSSSRVNFWALDNASISGGIIDIAAKKDFFIRNEDKVTQEMQSLAVAQLMDLLTQGKQADKVKEAKAALVAKLSQLNAKGDIITAQQLAQNPKATMAALVDNVEAFNADIINVAIGLTVGDENAAGVAASLAEQASEVADAVPLYALSQKALSLAMNAMGESLAKNEQTKALAKIGEATSQLVSGAQLETSYGIIIKNLEFLNKLTNMTNPEYNR